MGTFLILLELKAAYKQNHILVEMFFFFNVKKKKIINNYVFASFLSGGLLGCYVFGETAQIKELISLILYFYKNLLIPAVFGCIYLKLLLELEVS